MADKDLQLYDLINSNSTSLYEIDTYIAELEQNTNNSAVTVGATNQSLSVDDEAVHKLLTIRYDTVEELDKDIVSLGLDPQDASIIARRKELLVSNFVFLLLFMTLS